MLAKMDRTNKSKPIVKTFRRGLRKPSVKITVSADIPSELFNSSPVKTTSPSTVVRRIMRFARGAGNDENDEAFTRITVDNSVVDFPTCIDFGIQDFLCCKDEIDVELSSDTESYLEATPPHRFSDSELESHIEIMSITLDNVLNLYPRRESFCSPRLSNDETFTFDLVRIENQVKNVADTDNMDCSHSCQNESTQRQIVAEANSIPNNRRLPPPPRPFRRHISLPASIFMTYLMTEKHNQSLRNKDKRTSLSNNIPNHPKEFIRNERFSSRKLSRVDGSYSSNESTEAEEISPNASKSNLICGSDDQHHDQGDDGSGSIASERGDSRDTLVLSHHSHHGGGFARFINNSDSWEEDFDQDDDKAFTSELERKSLMLRCMRKLVRQDTSGNFPIAPPDYCI